MEDQETKSGRWGPLKFRMMLPLRYFILGVGVILVLEILPPLLDFLLPHRNPQIFFEWYNYALLAFFSFAFFSAEDAKKILLIIVSAAVIIYFSYLYFIAYIVFIVLLYLLLRIGMKPSHKLALFIIYLALVGGVSIIIIHYFWSEAISTLAIMVLLNSLGKKAIYLFYETVSEKITSMRLLDFIFYLTFLPLLYPPLPLSPSELLRGFHPGRKYPPGRMFMHGTWSVLWGLCKIGVNQIVLHSLLRIANFSQMHASIGSLAVWQVWGIVFLNYVLWYFYLSGIYGVSLGIANMCGVHIKPNFINPLLARDPLDLWKRWNIHYRAWLLRVFYFPLWWKYKIVYLNVFIVFLISGFSHTFASIFKSSFESGEFIYFIVQAFPVMLIIFLNRRANVGGDVEGGSIFRLKTMLSIGGTFAYTSMVHVLLFGSMSGLTLSQTWDIYLKLFGLE